MWLLCLFFFCLIFFFINEFKIHVIQFIRLGHPLVRVYVQIIHLARLAIVGPRQHRIPIHRAAKEF